LSYVNDKLVRQKWKKNMNMMLVRVSAWVLLPAAALLCGCAGFGKRLESPQISLVHMEVQEAKWLETVLRIELRVFNTNDVPLTVRGIDCTMEVNGKDFAQGVSDASVTIPAHGTAVVPVAVYSSIANMVLGVLRLQEKETLQYKMKGRLRLKGGFMMPSLIPFDTEGEISLKKS
jgi:LEA14-like dessication related protein